MDSCQLQTPSISDNNYETPFTIISIEYADFWTEIHLIFYPSHGVNDQLPKPLA
jgi:hypothetical protein